MKILQSLAIVFCFINPILAQFGIGDLYPISSRNLDYIEELYRNPTAQELKKVAVDSEMIGKNKNFLSQNNTGIFRLMPDLGCNENKNVVVVKEECLQYTMPGSGAGFSFRKNNYRLWRLADLIYKKGVFFSGSRYNQGIIGVLGDVNLEDVSLNSTGVKQLSEFVPESDYKIIEKQYKNIERGFIVNGVLFSNKLKVKENSTYILRSIAYRTKSYLTLNDRIIYDEFAFDKRFDILIAFRVLKKDKDNSVIILWKELERKESPKLKFPTEK